MSNSAAKFCYEDAKEKWNMVFSVDLFESFANNCSSVEQVIMRAAIKVAGDACDTVCKGTAEQRATRDDDEGTTIIDSTLFSVPSPRPPTEEGVEFAEFVDGACLVTPRASRFSRPAPGLGEESP